MRIDGLAVILAIILLPIILVVTYYIQMQVDTISTENSYNTKLLDATYDAMSAFEINTANEQYSSSADSLRSIIKASNNIFFNTLATNFGLSNERKEYIQPYVPAILYTMYDGFYIYAPTETAEVAENASVEGNGLTTTTNSKPYLSVGDVHVFYLNNNNYSYNKNNDNEPSVRPNSDDYGKILYYKKNASGEKDKNNFTTDPNDTNAYKKKDHVLKSYIQYVARYQHPKENPTTDVTISYTLDNYLNIEGTIDGVYYTKTGYLIKSKNNDGSSKFVSEFKIIIPGHNNGGGEYTQNSNLSEEEARNLILGYNTNADESTIYMASEVSVTVGGQKIDVSLVPTDEYKTIKDAEEYLAKHPDNNLRYKIQQYKAAAYYISNSIFSNWVYTHLQDLEYGDIKDNAVDDYYSSNRFNISADSGTDDFYYKFTDNATKIFGSGNLGDPEAPDSNFNAHKLEVIKNSIKYNLNLVMSAYENVNSEYQASLPILSDSEWDKILSNISIVAFMQGWKCGLDIYNNYQIATSTNNEFTVTPEEIYYVPKGEFNNENSIYHRIDCPDLVENSNDDQYISFKSKEIKYDKVYENASNSYVYDHKNLACYRCINTNNYKEDSLFNVLGISNPSYYDKINSLKKSASSTDSDSVAKEKAGYAGIAAERQSIYKMNALPVSEGYKVVYNNSAGTTGGTVNFDENSKFKLSEIKGLEIIFSDIKFSSTGNQAEITINVGGFESKKTIFEGDSNYKITLDVHSNSTENIESIKIDYNNSELQSYKIKNIKAIYK